MIKLEGLFTDLAGAVVRINGGDVFSSIDCEELYVVESIVFEITNDGFCSPYLYLRDLEKPVNIEDIQILKL